MSRNKGIHLLIDAAKQIGPTVDISVYGPLIDISKDEMKEAGIFYGGIISYDEVQSELSNYHYFCLPTMHEGEGYPGSIIEAFNAGIPVISSKWRAIPELVTEDETGILFEPGDSKSLVLAIQKAHKNHMNGLKFDLADIASMFDANRIYLKLAKDLLN